MIYEHTTYEAVCEYEYEDGTECGWTNVWDDRNLTYAYAELRAHVVKEHSGHNCL